MDKIKKFIGEKSADRRFKKAGPGQKLGTAEEETERKRAEMAQAQAEAAARRQNSASSAKQPTAAALAAQQRMQAQQAGRAPKPKTYSNLVTSADVAAMKAQAESNLLPRATSAPQPATAAHPEPEPESQSVRLICPFCNGSFPKSFRTEHLSNCLITQCDGSPQNCAFLIQVSCKDQAKRQACTTTLQTYLGNLIKDPENPKFRSIRLGNKAFVERVASVLGGVEFLRAVGYTETTNEEDGEAYLKFEGEVTEQIAEYVQVLASEATPQCRLDRQLQVFRPSSGCRVAEVTVPQDFYEVTVSDLRTSMDQRQAKQELESTLRTKAMREADKTRGQRKYRYTLLRIRFPDGLIVQGTFNVLEPFEEVNNFIREQLVDPTTRFYLHAAPGRTRFSGDKTLKDAGLVPSAVLNFSLEEAAAEAVPAGSSLLKPEVAQAEVPLL